MSVPKRLVVEYEDSSTKGVDFSQVDRQTQSELARLGLCPIPAEVGVSKYYLLLRWKDGWQEVAGVNGDTVNLLRYYVIRRIEDRGRLSLEVGADEPELFIIKRMPRELDSLLIIGRGSARSYELAVEVETWEGVFEAGGKKEYIKYNKTEPRHPHEFSDPAESLAEMMNYIRKRLDERVLSPQALLLMEQDERIAEYKEIARGIDVRGKERQEDVYGFIELMVRRLADLQS